MTTPELVTSEAELNDRRESIRHWVQQLVKAAWIGADFRPIGAARKAIAIHQGATDFPYTDWRVSVSDALALSYYEVWEYLGARQARRRPGSRRALALPRYRLIKAYFHVYEARSELEEHPLLLLHCDPTEPESSIHYKYKIGPHIHLEVAGDPWRKAHIALCHGWQKQALRDLGSLDRAMTCAVELVSDELISLAVSRKELQSGC
ncbi:MAG: hypothetical protein KAX19_04190 [Candidatus Brocadiae bacterium]|nr:hypothetical protein [Candidatus Brocadiia bacterium]